MNTFISEKDFSKNSFDFLRFFLAFTVIVSHSFGLINGPKLKEPLPLLDHIIYKSLGEVAVASFFILSGFLLTRSWLLKPNIVTFIKKRFYRIFPGIAVVTFLTVITLGFFSKIPYQEYLIQKQTLYYFLNLFLYPVHYILPGIFQNNPYALTVNGSLWSLSYEWTCYMMLLLIGYYGFINKKKLLLFYTTIYLLSLTGIFKNIVVLFTINIQTFFSLSMFFLAGSLFYVYADKISLKKHYALISFCTFMLLLLNPYLHFGYTFLGPLFLTYVLLYISFNTSYLNNFGNKLGDLSYGLYIYAFPVQQLLISISGNTLNVLQLFLFSFLISLILAYLSWNIVEKRFLKRKNIIKS